VVVAVPEQPPVETPPVVTATPTAAPTTVPPATGILEQFASFFSSPLNIIIIAGVALGVVVAVVAVAKLAATLSSHPLAKSLAGWLGSPSTDAIVIGLDPFTRECRLIPVKRVGPIYVHTEGEPAYTIPVGGGESYVLSGTGKPVIIALVYRHGVQHNPAQEQTLSLSLHPLVQESEEPVFSLRDVERALLSKVEAGISQISGEVRLGPDARIYVSARVPRVLELLRREVAYFVSANLEAVKSELHAVQQVAAAAIEAHRRLLETKRVTLIMGIAVTLIVIGVVLFILKQAGFF